MRYSAGVLIFLVASWAWAFWQNRQAVKQGLSPWNVMGEAPKAEPPDFRRLGLYLLLIAVSFGLFVFVVQAWPRWVRPPYEVYRQSLLKVAVPALKCPAENLTFEQVDSAGTRVTGCGRSAQFTVRTPDRLNHTPMWFPDSGCRQTIFFIITAPC